MNISQHLFVPRGKNISGKYYALSGTFVSNSYASTTEKQICDVYNCYQLFGNFMPKTGTMYALRLFEPADGSEGSSAVGLSNSGYLSPLLARSNVTYTSSAFTFRNNYYSGLPVLSVMWYEKSSPVLISSRLGSSFTPDVIVNEEEAI